MEETKLELNEFQRWVKDYYEARGWSELNIFTRIGFLAEETGEVARAIRAIEIGRDRQMKKHNPLKKINRSLLKS